MLAVLVLEAIRYEGQGALQVDVVFCVLRLEGGGRSVCLGIIHVSTVRPAASARIRRMPHADRAVLPMPHRVPAGTNSAMRLDPFRSKRDRRTATVIEILRRRAELRRARGEAVPPALRETIAEFDRHPHGASRRGHAPRSDPR